MTTTLSMGMLTGEFFPSGFKLTVFTTLSQVSFCMSMLKNRSMPYSKNSHSTPMVMEKQKATTATNTGESRTLNRRERLRMSTIAMPMAAIKKPLMV